MDFGAHLGALGRPREGIKGQKRRSKTIWIKSSIWDRFEEGLGRVFGVLGVLLEGFREAFGMILGGSGVPWMLQGASWVSPGSLGHIWCVVVAFAEVSGLLSLLSLAFPACLDFPGFPCFLLALAFLACGWRLCLVAVAGGCGWCPWLVAVAGGFG